MNEIQIKYENNQMLVSSLEIAKILVKNTKMCCKQLEIS